MSGMRPTGDLHLGHLVGVLTQWATYCALGRRCSSRLPICTRIRPISIGPIKSAARATKWSRSGSPPASIRSARRSFCSRACRRSASCMALLSMITPVSWLERVPTYQGADRRARPEDRDVRIPRLSAAAALRHRDRARRVRAGRARSSSRTWSSAAKSCAASTISTATASRDARRAATDALGVSRSAGHRRAQDEQIVRQRDLHRRRRRDDHAQSALRWSPIRRKCGAAIPAGPRSARSSRCGASSIR